MTDNRITRRALLGHAATLAGVAVVGTPAIIGTARAAAGKFTLKMGNDLPVSHPVNTRLHGAVEAVAQRSDGRLRIRLFPANQLGSDTDMLSQIRSGATECLVLSGNILSVMLPVAGLYNVPFAFKDYDHVWAAMDGDMGNWLRAKLDGLGLHALDKHWDNGFRQITSSDRQIKGPDDLKGFKIRVPVSPIWLSLFSALGASPTPINWSEAYTALQTHIVDGQENALPVIDSAKLYEVQKYVAMTNHMWDGYYILVNKRSWEKLPLDLQRIMTDAVNEAAVKQRQDMVDLNRHLEAKLTAAGMVFNRPENEAFREVLVASGFYAEWKKKYGDEAWSLLERFSGALG